MTDKEFDEKVASIEARAKRVFQMVVTLAGAVALTVLSLFAAWHQVMDAQQDIAQVNAHTAVNDNRLDKVGAPPPDPEVAAAAIQAGE